MKPTAAGSSFSYICFAIYFICTFYSDLLNQKYKKYHVVFYFYLFYLAFDLSIYYKFTSGPLPILRCRTPEWIDNPFNMSGCEVLLSLCKGCLRCVAWFSYWFDNLDLITKGNTYRRCAASTTKKYTSVMIRVCHGRSRFLSCMYIHDKIKIVIPVLS